MSNHITYPHGFRTLNSKDKDDKTEFVFDNDVYVLYNAYINREIDFADWDYRLNVIEETFRLFGANFEEWVLYQINENTLVYDHSLEFLLDTLNFITGSGRRVSTFVWRELLLNNPPQKSRVEISNRRIRKLKEVFPKIPTQTADVIQLWCSQEDGFEDLIISLFIFFGPATNMNNKAIQAIPLV